MLIYLAMLVSYICVLFNYFTILTELARTFSIKLKKSGNSIHLNIVPKSRVRACLVTSAMSNSMWPTKLLSSWDSLGKNTGVGCHALLQGIFLTQGTNSCLLHCTWILYPLRHLGREKALNQIIYICCRVFVAKTKKQFIFVYVGWQSFAKNFS